VPVPGLVTPVNLGVNGELVKYLPEQAFLAKTVCSMQHMHEAGYSACIPSSGVIETRTAHV